MRIRSNVTLTLAIVLAAIIVEAWFATETVIGGGFQRLESENARLEANHIAVMVEGAAKPIETTIMDWGTWDDSYYAALTDDRRFMESNVQPESLNNIDVQVFMLLNASGDALYSLALNPETLEPEAFPAEAKAELQPGMPLLQPRTDATPKSGWMRTGGGLLYLTAKPLMRSDGSGPSAGTIVMGRYISNKKVAELADSMDEKATLRTTGVGDLPADFKAAEKALAREGEYVRAVNDSTVSAYTLIMGIDDAPAAILRVDSNREIRKVGQQTGSYMLAALIATSAVFIILFAVYLDMTLVSRIRALTRRIDEVEAEGGSGNRLPEGGDDELADVANHVNRMLDAIDLAGKRRAEAEEALKLRVAELEKVSKAMVDRELSMVELKRRLAELEDPEKGRGGAGGPGDGGKP